MGSEMQYQLSALISRRQFLLASTLFWLPFKLQAKRQRGICFQHGVASGDPLQDRVIIWTRITSAAYDQSQVGWEVAQDLQFNTIVRHGNALINAATDYTVKVDVTGLQAGTTYYYRFRYNEIYSTTGTTRTLPEQLDGAAFHMAVVSCNNWEDGYFNAFRFLSEKQEVDLVLHLGDYIYEYATGEYGDTSIGRINIPAHEIISLQDYRQRYAHYRTDPDLQQLHATKPFCLIWDDHEIANDTYSGGAKNHQEKEGEWFLRKQAAIRAYIEWLPVRAKTADEMRRKISIGDDMDLLLLEERLQGRTIQMEQSDMAFDSPDRTMLGGDQYQWLTENLLRSSATWKLIGNQVMFSGYRVAEGFKQPKYNDWWLGYPYERNKLLGFLEKEKISNSVFLTGDHHQSFVLAVHREAEALRFTKTHEQRPLAWELLTPSITSKNGDRMTAHEVRETEAMLHRNEINPHLVFADIKSHGYFIATIAKTKFKADYYFTDNLRSRHAQEVMAASFTIKASSFTINKHDTDKKY